MRRVSAGHCGHSSTQSAPRTVQRPRCATLIARQMEPSPCPVRAASSQSAALAAQRPVNLFACAHRPASAYRLASVVPHSPIKRPSRLFHANRTAFQSSPSASSDELAQFVTDGKDALRKSNLGQATVSLTSAYKMLLESANLATPHAREVFRVLASTYLSQSSTKGEILDAAQKLLNAISRSIDKSLDKATIAEGLLVDIMSAVLRSSLPLKPSVWMPVFVRLSAVQNTVHQCEARIAANLLGACLHVQEPDLSKAKESAERAVALAKDDARYQAEALAALGQVEAARGDAAASKTHYKRALSLIAPSQRPADASPQKPEAFAAPAEDLVDLVVELRCRVGRQAVAEKDWRAAEDYYGDAIKNAERVYGRGSVRVAGLLHHVAMMYATRGHFWDTYAEGLFKKALALHEEHAMRDAAYLALQEDYAAFLAKNPARSSELELAKQAIARTKARLSA